MFVCTKVMYFPSHFNIVLYVSSNVWFFPHFYPTEIGYSYKKKWQILFISVHKGLIHHSVFHPFIHRTFTGHSLEEGFI